MPKVSFMGNDKNKIYIKRLYFYTTISGIVLGATVSYIHVTPFFAVPALFAVIIIILGFKAINEILKE